MSAASSWDGVDWPWGAHARDPEELLLEAFLRQTKLTRSAVIASDGRGIVICNRVAGRTLQLVDQALVLEFALDSAQGLEPPSTTVTLSDGTDVSLTHTRVNGANGSLAGVVVVARRQPQRGTGRGRGSTPVLGALTELPGFSPRWRQMTEQIIAAGGSHLVLHGERGTGKLTIAKALAPPGEVTVLDAEIHLCEGRDAWLRALCGFAENPRGSLILTHIEHLDIALVRAGTRVLDSVVRKGHRVLATATTGRGELVPRSLRERLNLLVEVPALRERIDDLPVLLQHMTRLQPTGGVAPSWMPDTVQALRKLDWPGNLRQLDGLVREVLRRTSNPYIGKLDLPKELLAEASPLQLTTMGQLEARALTKALRDAEGNKLAAANALGIARSTLYRRMRAHGIHG